jgi:hypothetical protein
MAEDTETETGKGTRFRQVNCGMPLHRIPDQIVTTGLSGQLARHVGHHWYAVIMFADGRGAAIGAHNHTPVPSEDKIEAMARWAVALNRDLHEDGHWIVAWSSAEQCPVLLWRDADGDIHIAIEVAVDARDPRGLEAYDRARILNAGAEALTVLRAQVMKAAVLPNQQVNLAQGGEALARHLAAMGGRIH